MAGHLLWGQTAPKWAAHVVVMPVPTSWSQKGLLATSATGGLLRDAVGPNADDKTVGDVFLQGGENWRRAVVHGQWAADVVADLGVAGHVRLGDRRLNHGHLWVLLQG